MAEVNDDRTTMPGEHRRPRYHHGNLQNALTDAATEMARTGGPDAVVLRAAAREAGVSAAAAYRHFADHSELLRAVRERAVEALGDAMRASLDAVEPVPDPAAVALLRFRALGRAYIEFALTDPGLFRTAFCRPDKPVQAASQLIQSKGPYALVAGVLDDLVSTGVLDPRRRPGAEIAVWSAVHGLSTLLLDGPLALLSEQERALAIEVTGDFMLEGLAPAPR